MSSESPNMFQTILALPKNSFKKCVSWEFVVSCLDVSKLFSHEKCQLRPKYGRKLYVHLYVRVADSNLTVNLTCSNILVV